jgi:hypothetical protein
MEAFFRKSLSPPPPGRNRPCSYPERGAIDVGGGGQVGLITS